MCFSLAFFALQTSCVVNSTFLRLNTNLNNMVHELDLGRYHDNVRFSIHHQQNSGFRGRSFLFSSVPLN